MRPCSFSLRRVTKIVGILKENVGGCCVRLPRSDPRCHPLGDGVGYAVS